MNSKTSEIFEFNKMMFIYLIAILTATVWAVHYLTTKSKQIYKPRYMVILLIFLFTQILSAYNSIDIHTSIFGYYGRWNGGLISIIAYLVLFFVFVQTFDKKSLASLLKVSLVSSTVVMIWGLLAKFGYDFSCVLFVGRLTNLCWTDQFKPAERMFSTLGQPNWLGAYLCIHFFIGLYFFVKQIDFAKLKENVNVASFFPSFNSYIYILYVVMVSLCLIFTKSRSSILAVGIAVVIGLFLLTLKRYRLSYWIIIPVIGIVVAFFVLIPQSPSLLQIHDSSPSELAITDSFDIRKIVWDGAIELGKKYPYFGSGVETFAYAYYFTRPLAHNRTSEWDFIYNKAHNEYLNYFATTGTLGLIGYLSIILGVFVLFFVLYQKYLKRNDVSVFSHLSLSLILSYITILITNFFGFSISNIQIFFYLIPAMILVDAGNNKLEHDGEKFNFKEITLWRKGALGIVGIIVFSGIIYWGRYYLADIAYSEAKGYIAADEYAKATEYLYKAMKLKYEHVYQDKLSNTLAYLAFQVSFDDKKEAQDVIQLSKYSNLQTLKIAPKNMLYWKTRSRNHYLYFQVTHDMKDLQKSIESMETATQLAPTDVQTYYALAVLYITISQETSDAQLKEEYKVKAKDTFEKIFKMKPDYREAQELNGTI